MFPVRGSDATRITRTLLTAGPQPTLWEIPVEVDPSGEAMLRAGFPLVPWLGGDGVPPEAMLDTAADGSRVEAIFVFHAPTQVYRVFRPGAFPMLNSLPALNRYDVMLILASAQTTSMQ